MAGSQQDFVMQDVSDLKKLVEDMRSRMEDIRARMEDVISSIKKQQDRVIVMIDRSNLDQTWRRVDNSGVRPDYVKMTEFLSDARLLRQVRIYYSDIDADMVPESERVDWQRRQDFYSFLRHQGWILRCVKKKIYEGVHVEKGLDATLIRDMERICRNRSCDTIVLVAGDADYCDVVYEVQERYCVKVEVAFFPNQTARDLQSKASRFINLECVKDKIVRKPQP